MLQNPFFVIRYASFSVILFLNVITLVFAAINVSLMKASGRTAPGASVLLLFNAAAFFLSIAIALIELVVVKIKTAKVKYECVWTAIMAVLQLAASLSITTTGPPLLCRPDGSLQACTSVTVLVPVAWLSSFTIVTYFLILSITTIVYAPSLPGIWEASVYSVPWFSSRDKLELTITRKASTSTNSSVTLRNTPRTKGIWDDECKDDMESQCGDRRTCFSIAVAPWAKPFQNRRGQDRPFATRSQVLAANPGIPPPPPKSYPSPIATRYLELSRQSSVTEVSEFRHPHTLSQWVRADLAEGRNVHTRPPITPKLPIKAL